MSLIRNKKARVLFGLFATLAVTAAAVAYWTASGSGSGTGSVGTDAGVTVDNVSIATTLYPGGSSAVNARVTNNSANSSVKVDKLVLDTAGITVDSGHSGCNAADFTYTADQLSLNLAANAASSGGKVGTIGFANSASNQDACKGATVTVHLKTDNSAL